VSHNKKKKKRKKTKRIKTKNLASYMPVDVANSLLKEKILLLYSRNKVK